MQREIERIQGARACQFMLTLLSVALVSGMDLTMPQMADRLTHKLESAIPSQQLAATHAIIGFLQAADERTLRVTRNSCSGGNTTHRARQAALVEARIAPVLASLLSAHATSVETKAVVARCVAQLADSEPKIAEAMGEAHAIQPLLLMAHGPLYASRWRDRATVHASEAALEALWWLTAGDGANIAELKHLDAVGHLAELAQNSPSEVARMWALGVLHRITRDYCDTPSTWCTEPAGGRLPKTVLSTQGLRARVVAHTQAIHTAIQAVRRGPAVVPPTALQIQGAGARIEIGSPSQRRGIEAWAGAALLHSLATTESSHATIVSGGAVAPLIRLSRSQDALERSQAHLTLIALFTVPSTREMMQDMDESVLKGSRVLLDHDVQSTSEHHHAAP